MEYDHMAELGLSEESQLIIADTGFITRNNPLRSLCERFVRDGGKIYDALARYDSVISYALSREDGNCGSVARWLVPVLKACGVTDKGAYDLCRETTELMPGAEEVLRYLSGQLPTYICTETYEHQMMQLADTLGFPMNNISCNMFSFDAMELPKPAGRSIREVLPYIAQCRLSSSAYSVNDCMYLTKEDSDLVDTVDEKLRKPFSKLEIMDSVRKDVKIAGNEKAYAVLELCRKNNIGVSDTAIIGTRNSDFPAMDIIRDASGLSVAFAGEEYAVRASNVAVLSDRPIVAAVLVNEFYNGGIESVHEMIAHWDIDGLKSHACADRNLVNELLAQFPNGLPEVFWVDRTNSKEIAAKSMEYRKKHRY